jgi:hypothetical protein
MLVEDPVFSGDKEKNPFISSIQEPVSSIMGQLDGIMGLYQNLTEKLRF